MLPFLSMLFAIADFIQGIAPTLIYPVPSSEEYWLLSRIIHSIRDYYPLWQVSLVIELLILLSLTLSSFVACLPNDGVLLTFLYLVRNSTTPDPSAVLAGGNPSHHFDCTRV